MFFGEHSWAMSGPKVRLLLEHYRSWTSDSVSTVNVLFFWQNELASLMNVPCHHMHPCVDSNKHLGVSMLSNRRESVFKSEYRVEILILESGGLSLVIIKSSSHKILKMSISFCADFSNYFCTYAYLYHQVQHLTIQACSSTNATLWLSHWTYMPNHGGAMNIQS